MIVLTRIKVKIINLVFPACENYVYTKSMCETGFVVDSPSLTTLFNGKVIIIINLSVCKIRHHESRTPDFSNDLIVDFVRMLLLVDSHWFVPSFGNRWLNACVPNFILFRRHIRATVGNQ